MTALLCPLLLFLYWIPRNECSGLLLGEMFNVNGFPATNDRWKKQSRFKINMVSLVQGIEDDLIPDADNDEPTSVGGVIFAATPPSEKIDRFTTQCGGINSDWNAFRRCLATCCYTEWGTVVNYAQAPFFNGGLAYIADNQQIPMDRQNPFKYFMKALWDATHRAERWDEINALIEAQQREWISKDSKDSLTDWWKKSQKEGKAAIGVHQPFPKDYQIFASLSKESAHLVESSLPEDKLVLWRGYSELIMLPGDKVAREDQTGTILVGPSSFTTDLKVAIQFATRRGDNSGVVIRAEIPKSSGDGLEDFGLLDIVKANYLSKYHKYQKEILLYNVRTEWLSVEQCIDAYQPTMAATEARTNRMCKAERQKREKGHGAHVEQYNVIGNGKWNREYRYRYRHRPNRQRSNSRFQRLINYNDMANVQNLNN